MPPHVEYFFTEEGKTLIPALEKIAIWGRYMGEKYGELEEVKNENAGARKMKKKSIFPIYEEFFQEKTSYT